MSDYILMQQENWQNIVNSEAAGKIMCGCYYVDDETAREIEKLIKQVDEKMRKAGTVHLQAGVSIRQRSLR